MLTALKASSISSDRNFETYARTTKTSKEQQIVALFSKQKSYKKIFQRRPCFVSKKSCYFYG
jgi:hypothetical protein